MAGLLGNLLSDYQTQLQRHRNRPFLEATMAACALVATADGEVSFAEAAGRSLFIHRTGEDFRVYDSRCPHRETNIPHLALEGGRLTCPKHNWAFDIASGECVEKGNRPLRRFEHKVEGGRLLAHW